MERLIYDTQSYYDDKDYIRDEIFLNHNDGEFATKEDITEEDIDNEINILHEIEWQDEKKRLMETFDEGGNVFVLRGSAGLWYGRREGGAIIRSFSQLSRAWERCEDFKLYDKNGLFSIDSSHHDGTNCWEVKVLTERGRRYLDRHEGEMSERELHKKLFSYPYSKNIRFADRYYGKYRAGKSA